MFSNNIFKVFIFLKKSVKMQDLLVDCFSLKNINQAPVAPEKEDNILNSAFKTVPYNE